MSAAARIALLWSAGLLWEALDEQHVPDELRRRVRPAIRPLGLAGRTRERGLALAVLPEVEPIAEPPVRRLLTALRSTLQCVRRIRLEAERGSRARSEMVMPAMSLYEADDIDVRLVRGVLYPHRVFA